MRLKSQFIQFILGARAPMPNGNVALLVNMAWDLILEAEPAQACKPPPQSCCLGAMKSGVDWLGLVPGQVMRLSPQ